MDDDFDARADYERDIALQALRNGPAFRGDATHRSIFEEYRELGSQDRDSEKLEAMIGNVHNDNMAHEAAGYMTGIVDSPKDGVYKTLDKMVELAMKGGEIIGTEAIAYKDYIDEIANEKGYAPDDLYREFAGAWGPSRASAVEPYLY
ncbi:hypothetical protein [Kushneria phyllosphaerae]|uniref:Uncharacterized protein n=1 Tax=Kushneria phyllosphaerae TaxID=2100822 RepID=A0A2R8CKS8_9GAMM|nr:hypothetical protein [Kushneria phyllosphaerae]SPJ33443.1 hypothetical protein KSP9073_01452 [Kushneria phyllosphaerae]